MPSSILTSRTTMFFSLQHRIARYPGLRQTARCLGSIAESSSHRQVSCIHTTMSSQVFAFVIMHFAAVTSSSSISRWNRYSYLSRRCVLRGSSKGPRRVVLRVPPDVVTASPSFSHSLSTLRQITIRTQFQYLRSASPLCCQNIVRTSPLYCHRFITTSSKPSSTLPNWC